MLLINHSFSSMSSLNEQFDEEFKLLVQRQMNGSSYVKEASPNQASLLGVSNSIQLSQPIAIDFGRRKSLQLDDIYARQVCLEQDRMDDEYVIDDMDDEEVFKMEL
ncbi:hypothetical protein THRCLA_20248 [Thraustotheca clavata]|uniref:Uncharacterized protein n=1 Tax=Thraustotheca clavata TaxID=74557 RepID=A0A1W0A9V0_9STRA|nr:hypothetical protein THRCLA_20248 [Thraustotheca clavata]